MTERVRDELTSRCGVQCLGCYEGVEKHFLPLQPKKRCYILWLENCCPARVKDWYEPKILMGRRKWSSACVY